MMPCVHSLYYRARTRMIDKPSAGAVSVSDTYDTDSLIWSERQSALLLRVRAGEAVNDQVDWVNIAEEIESVGRSELHAVELLLVQALRQMLKAEAWPLSRDAPI